MASKTVLTLSQLLDLLSHAPLSPAEVASKAEVSLATANRKLKEALYTGLAVKVGKGPAMRYRASTPEEQIQVLNPSVVSVLPSGDKVFMELTTEVANGLLQGISALLERGEPAPELRGQLSEIYEALEHRLSWDASARVSAPIPFKAEPVELLANVKVSSGEQPPGLLDLLDSLPAGHYLGRTAEGFEVVGRNYAQDTLEIKAQSHSPQTVILKVNAIKR